MLSRHSAIHSVMDVIPQLTDRVLESLVAQAMESPLVSDGLPTELAPESILRPFHFDASDSFSRYFSGSGLPGPESPAHLLAIAPGQGAAPAPVMAQYFDQDFLGDMGRVWNNFVESGQLWALLFGIVVGYMIRNLTAF